MISKSLLSKYNILKSNSLFNTFGVLTNKLLLNTYNVLESYSLFDKKWYDVNFVK